MMVFCWLLNRTWSSHLYDLEVLSFIFLQPAVMMSFSQQEHNQSWLMDRVIQAKSRNARTDPHTASTDFLHYNKQYFSQN